METVQRDCFWCGETYDMGKNERCPRCSTDVDTRAISIINDGEQQSKSVLRRLAIMAEAEASGDGENETTSSTN